MLREKKKKKLISTVSLLSAIADLDECLSARFREGTRPFSRPVESTLAPAFLKT